MNMLMGLDSPMAATLRPARDTTFFFGGGGPKKRVMKRIDLDSDGEEGADNEEGVDGFQESRGYAVFNLNWLTEPRVRTMNADFVWAGIMDQDRGLSISLSFWIPYRSAMWFRCWGGGRRTTT